MNNEDKISVYLTILAYTAGNWTPEQIKEAYDFLAPLHKGDHPVFKLAEKPVPDAH